MKDKVFRNPNHTSWYWLGSWPDPRPAVPVGGRVMIELLVPRLALRGPILCFESVRLYDGTCGEHEVKAINGGLGIEDGRSQFFRAHRYERLHGPGSVIKFEVFNSSSVETHAQLAIQGRLLFQESP